MTLLQIVKMLKINVITNDAWYDVMRETGGGEKRLKPTGQCGMTSLPVSCDVTSGIITSGVTSLPVGS